MNLAALVKLILRANRAGRAPVEPWQDDTAEADAKRFIGQFARMVPGHETDIQILAFPSHVRVQLWCETFACEFVRIGQVARDDLALPAGPCPQCDNALHRAVVHSFVYIHPNLFDAWTLDAPNLEAAEVKFEECWNERTGEGGDCAHLTGSSFGQGVVMLEDDYEAT